MAPSSTPPRGRGWLWFLVALLALVGVAWGAMAILFPPTRARALVQAQLARSLARDVRFADASIGIFPPVRLTVKQLELAEPEGFAAGSAFQARALLVDLDVFALLGRRLLVRRLILDQPMLHLLVRPDGTTNFDGIGRAGAPGPPGAQAKPMDLELSELRIDGGHALIDDQKSARRTTFQLDSKMTLALREGGARVATSGQTTLSALAFGPLSAARVADLNHSLAKLEWKIEHRGAFDATTKRLALERLAIGFGKTQIALQGVVDDPGPQGRVNLRARAIGVELGDILDFLAAADAKAVSGIRGAGRLDFDLGIQGPLGPGKMPSLTGAFAVADGSFHYPDAPAGVEALSLSARIAPDSLSIPRLSARVTGPDGRPLAPITGAIDVAHFADPYVRFTMDGPVNLAAVAPLVAPKDTKLTGLAAVRVQGQGRAKDPGSLTLQGRAKLVGVSVETPQLPKKIDRVDADLEFATTKATVRNFTMKAGQSAVTLDATITRPLALMGKIGKVDPAGVDFTLRSPYLDLAELLPVTPGSPVLPNARGKGTVAIERLKNQKLDVSHLSATVGLTPGVLEVPSYALHGYGGAVKGSARFDLTDPAVPQFAVKAKVDTVEADALLSAWTPARGWLHGSLDTNLDLSGAGTTPDALKRTLTAAGLALVSDGSLGPGPALQTVAATLGMPSLKEVRFRDLKMPFRVERGRFITDPVTLEGKTGKWQLVGGVGFDGRLDYAVSVTLPPDVVAKLDGGAAFASRALADAQGNVLVDFKVSGPAKAPHVQLDSRAMRDRLAGKLSQALVEQRTKLEEDAKAALLSQQQATTDSARRALVQNQKAIADSLKRRAKDLFKGFFGGGAKDTTPH
jgi:hypothetical protein